MEQIDISHFAKTRAEAMDFAERLGAVSEMIYTNNFNLDTALIETLGMKKKDIFLSLLRDQKIQTSSLPALKEFMQQLQQTALTLPVLELQLAFEPNTRTLQLLSEWFLLNLKKQILFEIHVDPSMIAGVGISYKGRHLDFSLKPSFLNIVAAIIKPKPKEEAVSQQATKKAIYHNPDNMHV